MDPVFVWNDVGSGGDYNFACYHPNGASLGSGHFAIGHFGTASYGQPQKPYVVTVEGENRNDVFEKPSGLNRIWTDSGSGAHEDGSFWTVSCPSGYGSLSDVCQIGHDQPSLDVIWCVKDKYLENDYHDQFLWNDAETGADVDIDIMGGNTELTKEFVAVTTSRGEKKSLKKISNTYL